MMLDDDFLKFYAPYAAQLVDICAKASELALRYAPNNLTIMQKDDSSPVTDADIALSEFIVGALGALDSGMQVLSEESPKSEQYAIAKSSAYWIIDPIDGTKSFIKGNDDFTVNIGLVANNYTIGGVVAAPKKNVIYYVDGNARARRSKLSCLTLSDVIHAQKASSDGEVVVTSRTNSTSKTDAYMRTLIDVKERLCVSSSYKFCMVADGSATLYPRIGPTMEWDTAAGQAIVEAAGGEVICMETNQTLAYGKSELRNHRFYAKVKS